MYRLYFSYLFYFFFKFFFHPLTSASIFLCSPSAFFEPVHCFFFQRAETENNEQASGGQAWRKEIIKAFFPPAPGPAPPPQPPVLLHAAPLVLLPGPGTPPMAMPIEHCPLPGTPPLLPPPGAAPPGTGPWCCPP